MTSNKEIYYVDIEAKGPENRHGGAATQIDRCNCFWEDGQSLFAFSISSYEIVAQYVRHRDIHLYILIIYIQNQFGSHLLFRIVSCHCVHLMCKNLSFAINFPFIKKCVCLFVFSSFWIIF